MHPAGNFLLAANHKTDSIVNFLAGQQAGALEPGRDMVSVLAQVCVKILPIPAG